MNALGIDLADSAVQVIGDSFVRGLPYLALVLVVAATSYYQQRQISARQTNQVANPQQQMLLKVMPALFAVISLTFPAGLIVYFLTSNLYRIAQNTYITDGSTGPKRPTAGAGGQRRRPAGRSSRRPEAGDQGRHPARPADAPRPGAARRRPTPTPKSRRPTAAPPKGNPARGPAARPPARPNPRPSPTKPTPKKKK